MEILEPLDDGAEGHEDAEAKEEGMTSSTKGISSSKTNDTTWHASVPGTTFGINAFAEAWEYEAEDDEDENIGFDSNSPSASRKYPPGVLAKKANKTVVQLDLAVGREASGQVRVPLYITYTYTAEEPLITTKGEAAQKSQLQSGSKQVSGSSPSTEDTPLTNSGEEAKSNLKSFSFWASIPLGRVVPRVGLPGGSMLGVRDGQARRMPSASDLQ